MTYQYFTKTKSEMEQMSDEDLYVYLNFEVDRYEKYKKTPKYYRAMTEERSILAYAITINPSPDVSLETFQKVISRVIKKKWVHDYEYVYEQRGKTQEEMGQGIHCHMCLFLEKYKRRVEIERELYSTCKNIVGNPKHIVVKCITNLAGWEAYLLKDIADPDKAQKSQIDRLFRENNNLLEIYRKNAIQTDCEEVHQEAREETP